MNPLTPHLPQASLLSAATAFRDENIVDVTSYEQLKEVIAAGGLASVCFHAFRVF